jgi:hypothetical protein
MSLEIPGEDIDEASERAPINQSSRRKSSQATLYESDLLRFHIRGPRSA